LDIYKKKISVLITNYNKGKFLEKCLNSCLRQNQKNLEIIICDNFSTDKSQIILKNFAGKIIVKRKKKISNFGAKNQIDLIKLGYKFSSGAIICLLDGDDFLLKDKIKIISNLFERNKRIEVIYDLPLVKSKNACKKFELKKKFNQSIWPTIIPTSSISFRRNFFSKCLKLGIFNDYNFLEIDFRINVFSRNIEKKFIILDKNLTVYRDVRGGIMDNIKKHSYNWWIKRQQAHFFMRNIYKIKNKKYFYINADFVFTLIINFILRFFYEKSLHRN
jgi:glycosyltransferase involved in cell wall biosynthesis